MAKVAVPGSDNGEKPDEQPKTGVVEQTSQHVFLPSSIYFPRRSSGYEFAANETQMSS